MSDWTDERKARLEADIRGEPFDGVYLLTRQRADIRAALDHAEDGWARIPAIEAENKRLRQRVEELETHWKDFMKWDESAIMFDYKKRAEASDAKLARCVEALEQIDRETRSASDVAALRYGSIARVALAAAKGGE